MLNRRFLFICALIAIFLASCHSTRKTGKEDETVRTSLEYMTFDSKVMLSIGSISLNAHLKMKKDSFLSVSVQPFAGVEIARLFANREEVYLVDRINKRYSHMVFDAVPDFGKYLNLNAFQAILTNSLFLLGDGKSQVTRKDFSESQVASSILLQRAVPDSHMSQEFTTDENLQVKNGTILSEEGSVHWVYSQYEALENGFVFPKTVDISVVRGGRNPSPKEISISYKKIELNNDIRFSNPIPKGYEEVSVEKILSAF